MHADLLHLWLCASKLSEFFSAENIPQQHIREYSDLFYGTDASVFIPLWASACENTDGTLMDETTLAVLRAYRRAGYVPAEMDGNPPDFIGQQLRFFCHLCAAVRHDSAVLVQLQDFCAAHLAPTAAAVSAGIRQYTETPYFLSFAEQLCAFCAPIPTEFMSNPAPFREQLLCFEIAERGLPAPLPESPQQTVLTAGRNNCGGRCSVQARVQDGCLLSLDAVPSAGDPTVRGCVRSKSYRTTFLTPKRLRYPMLRTGARGEGKFRRITWEQAADLIAENWKRIRGQYGPCSTYVNYGTGVAALIRPDSLVMRLLNLDGGFLGRYGSYSSACTSYITPYVYGDNRSGNSTEDILNTRLLLLWGHNPAETIFSPQLARTIAAAKQRGTRVIVIDPRQSDTALALADEWIPILPGSDAALADAMAYVIWSEGLHDREFMDRCCLGFDAAHMPEGVPKELNYHNYLFGGLDGVEKTPEWAAPRTGIPAETIRSLARDYASAKPACLLPGLGNQRTGCGEQAARGMMMLTCLTGNVGIPGGGAAGHGDLLEEEKPHFPLGEAAYPGVISCSLWREAVERGAEMTAENDRVHGKQKLDSNIKFLFNLASNILINQHADINRTAALLLDEGKLEFIVASDVFMTPSAKFADLLLPAPSFLEEENIGAPWQQGHYLLCHNKVIEPLFGCRSEYDWISDVAGRLGLWEAWSCGHTNQSGWLSQLYSELRARNPELPDYDTFRAAGGYAYRNPKPTIAYEKQAQDPTSHPFATPSGKIEICSPRLYAMRNPDIPAIPCHRPCEEGAEDPLRARYPLQLIGWHTKRRTHSIHDNSPLMERVEPQRLWIHPDDAAARGLKQDSLAEIYNARGRMRIPVCITQRIMRSVVAIPQGAWYTPDADGTDLRGSINILTADRPTPLAKGNSQHTNLVEVAAAE